MDHGVKAVELFKEGYNCTQAVAVAFCDVTGMDKDLVCKISSGFGGGMGRMREVCGAVSGMTFVLSQLYGYDKPDDELKKELYSYVQKCAHEFEDQFGSIVCHTLLGLEKGENNSFVPTKRDDNFYKKRPCPILIMNAAKILEKFINENGNKITTKKAEN